MAKKKINTLRYQHLKDDPAYQDLVTQISVLRTSMTKQKYVLDETKIENIKKALDKLIFAQEAYKADFETEKYNYLINRSNDILNRINNEN